MVKKCLCVFGQPIPYCILFQFEKILLSSVKWWNFGLNEILRIVLTCPSRFILSRKLQVVFLLVVGLLFFPLFSSRPKKIALNVEVYGQANSKAIYNDFLPESLILRLNFVVLVKWMLNRSLVNATENNSRKTTTGVRVICMAPLQTRVNCQKFQ